MLFSVILFCVGSTTSSPDAKTSKDDKGEFLISLTSAVFIYFFIYLLFMLYNCVLFADKKSKSSSSGSSSSSSRNLWVSGLSSSTRATDLKQVFSKYGKVSGKKSKCKNM